MAQKPTLRAEVNARALRVGVWLAFFHALLAADKIVLGGACVSLSIDALLVEASLPSHTTCTAVCTLLIPLKHTILLPFCSRQDNKIVPRGVGDSLSGTPLLAEASLRGAKLRGTSLSGILMLVNASLHGDSLGGPWGLPTPRCAAPR
jgi:hypothetical protein